MRRWLPIPLVLLACKLNDPTPITSQFYDGFERPELSTNYAATGDGYRLVAGQLSAHGAHNHPLWLKKKLTRDVRIEFECWSTEARGDLKVEIFGDGHSFDPDGGRYMASGYEVIFGGWYNAKSIIARMDEHGSQMSERTLPKVIPGKHYHWKIERKGTTITWWIDDMATPFLTYVDPRPLEGSGHEYFAFNNWETDTWFDNLVITPL